MQNNTHIIETPFGKHKVEIKDWITGEDREYINEPLYGSVKMKPEIVANKPDMKMGEFDVNKFIKESDHREYEKFVVSVDGLKEIEHEGAKIPAWQFVLKMHEDDTAFVKADIDSSAKKKGTQTTS
jgi:hypothetical protein